MDREYFDNLKNNHPKKSDKPKEKVKRWKVIHAVTKEIVISGGYSLCQWKLNQLPYGYKIVPDKQQ